VSEAIHFQPETIDRAVSAPDPPNTPASCAAVRFYGRELHIALASAAQYLRDWELAEGTAPAVVALHDEFSWEDSGRDIAWQLTLVLRDGLDSTS
jgi:hypothetical protein